MRSAAALTGLIGAAGWCGPGIAVHCPPVAHRLNVELRLEQEPGRVIVTFDDGPHPDGTPAVLDALADVNATAIFFLIGEQVERYPELVRDVVAAGHEVAVHGYRHRNQMRLTPRVFARDLHRAIAVMGEAAGHAPRFYRPPYGVFTPTGLAAVRRSGLQPLLWSKWGRDWRSDATPAGIADLATRGLAAGDVVLLHDSDAYSAVGSHRQTAAALPLILTEISVRGLSCQALGGERRAPVAQRSGIITPT